MHRTAVVWLTLALTGCLATDERPGVQRSRRSALGQGSGDGNACGSITFEGCCSGSTLYYCGGGQVLSVDCSQNLSCGWDSTAAFYNCGTAGQPEPGGMHPKACAFGDAGPPDLSYNSCGAITYVGCCHGEMLHFCDNGEVETIDCNSLLHCGWYADYGFYACGTGGQPDPSGKHPKACALDASVPDLWPKIPCGNVTYEGCCDGETLKYCESSGTLHTEDCSTKPFCGWNAEYNYYNCDTQGGADPSGTHPKACTALPDAGPYADICGKIPRVGCCDGQLHYTCASKVLHVQDCRREPSCGWIDAFKIYGCATAGAADPTGENPKACDFGDAAPPLASDSCNGLTWQGCCDRETVYYCDGGVLKWDDCGKTPFCGWRTKGSYSFYDCGTDGKADPSGQLPKACPSDAGMPDAPRLDASTACGPVTHQGCCDGETLYYCAGGALKFMDCAKSPSCGWQGTFSYYDCNTDGAGDPAGVHPRACGFDGGPPNLDHGQPLSSDRSIHDSRPADDAAAGCGCALIPRAPGGMTLLFLVLLVVTLRRRPS